MSGEAVLRVAPDRAFVDVSVETRARGPKEAQQQNAATMATVQEKLRGARLAADAVRTTSYDLQQEADYVNGKRVPRGYLARHSLEIRVDDIERVGEIVDLTVASGVANVSDVRFDLKQRDAVERDALKQAVADALARAEAAASGAGRRVERVLRVEEQRGIAAPRPMVLAMRADAAPPETSIAPGVLEIHAAVTLTAEIR